MLRLPLVYCVSFLAIFGSWCLRCELAWRWLRGAGTADDCVSASRVKNGNTER